MRTRWIAAFLSLSLLGCQVEPLDGDESPAGSVSLESTQDIQAALAALPSAQVLGTHEDNVPFMIRGRLGSVGSSLRGLSTRDAQAHVGTSLAAVAPVFRLKPADLVLRRISQDEQGHTHIRYDQTRNGLPVVGHELILHLDPAGTVYAANGSARDGEQVPSQPRISAEAARSVALRDVPGSIQAPEAPRLVYVRSSEDGRLKLAFEVLVTGEHAGIPVQEHVFVNALDGSVVSRVSDIHSARNRIVYTANNLPIVPGTVVCTETAGCSTTDVAANKVFANLGTFYDCFSSNFSRDSYNAAGAALKATVHYGSGVANAYWNTGSSSMICGDGDGSTVGPPCNAADIVIHELTHAVTSHESNLTYSNESGALNESLSDVFAAYCVSWQGGWSTGTQVWQIGEEIWTPSTPNDALRYLNHPTLDGSSKDYYPERFTGTSDNGGVHYNSGIPNLAFYLLSVGGKHPRAKTSIAVTGIGVQMAGQIFYKANRDVFTASTTFAQAKVYTEQAAAMLGYSSATIAEVTKAWQAVGVGTSVPPPPATPLTNGVTLSNLSGAASAESFFYLDVPASNTASFTLSGGTGDVDMYVKFGSAPTTASYDCRPYLTGNNETCTFAAKSTAGRYYVMLRGYSAYSGVSLRGQYP